MGGVVIRDDEVNSNCLRVLRFGNGAHAAIHTDDELHALLLFEQGERVVVQAIAIVHPMRDVGHHVCAKRLKRRHHERCRADAIHIVIAIDRNFFAVVQRLANARHRLFHRLELERVIAHLRAFKIRRRLFRRDLTIKQQLPNEVRERAQLGRQEQARALQGLRHPRDERFVSRQIRRGVRQ